MKRKKKVIPLPLSIIPLYQKGVVWLNARNLRERFILFIAAFIATIMIWNAVLYKPLQAAIKKRRLDISELNAQIAKIESETANLMNTLGNEKIPAGDQNQERSQLLEKAKKIDQALYGIQSNFVSSDQLIITLEGMLDHQEGLQLLRLDTAPAQAISESPAEADTAANNLMPGVYQHDITLVVLGDYFSVLNYLRSVESLGWRLFWDKMDYKVVRYPTAQVTIKMHILSADKGFNQDG